jgi:hypothetical protein
MRRSLLLAAVLWAACAASAKETVAVFPVNGVNTDISFVDAFGMLLATKYRNVSEDEVISPIKAGRAIAEDSSLSQAAMQLGASEYIEIDAVGLYLSRRERAKYEFGHGAEKTIIVKVEDDDDDDDDDEDDDQELLDNHKTIVSATRRDAGGNEIHTVEMTLVTYGDIEESTDRIARALYQKVSPEEVRGLDNVTRREGMGNNKVFVDNLKGVKFGFLQPLASGVEISSMVSFGYNHRFDSKKFFLEFGAGARLPTSRDPETQRFYGGAYLQMGGSYYLTQDIVALSLGLGVHPHFVLGPVQSDIGVLPYVQFGVSFPRNGQMQGILNLKVGQNALPITTGFLAQEIAFDDDIYSEKKESYPTEIGLEMGLAF